MTISDDPTGGRNLTRRLIRWLPVAFLCGLAIGVALALVVGDWRVAPSLAVGAAAMTGALLAAIEDGRVQRRVSDGVRRREADRAARPRRVDGEDGRREGGSP